MPLTVLADCKLEWQEAWSSVAFRKRVIAGMGFVIAIMCAFPAFFQHIEKRSGYPLQDPILAWLVPHDLSAAIFVVIWAITLLAIFRAVQTPSVFLTFLWCWVLLSLMRMLTITLVPLDTPVGLVGLMDPVSNFFYGQVKFVTKDLFFSGHTSTVFLLFFCLPGRVDRRLALLATVLVGYMLMVQHVHYSLDVFCAPFFAWLTYWIVSRFIIPKPELRAWR